MEAQSLGILVAFLAGLLSFLSPCVLPLIPSYASFITGMGLDELTTTHGGDERRRRMLTHGLLFVAGFSAVFIMLGASATLLGSFFFRNAAWIERIGGVLIIIFGLYLLGIPGLPGANREWRMHLADKPAGYAGTVLVGVAFGAGWTPCIGPVLGGILTLAATRESVGQGVFLLSVYSLGLAIPFLLATLALERFLSASTRFRRWLPWVSRVSGVLLIGVGILLLTGSFTALSALFARWTPDFLVERL
ncbi:MAG TPA: cytochrome c biogenesis CcdA family protein [Longimicrobiales bacterium]|nr:cytochrome c biogenesis CcdA family protein [Longimicrobiales bacterium]